MEASFKLVKARVKECIALYVWEIMHEKRNPILTNVFDTVISAQDDPWLRMVGDLVASKKGYE